MEIRNYVFFTAVKHVKLVASEHTHVAVNRKWSQENLIGCQERPYTVIVRMVENVFLIGVPFQMVCIPGICPWPFILLPLDHGLPFKFKSLLHFDLPYVQRTHWFPLVSLELVFYQGLYICNTLDGMFSAEVKKTNKTSQSIFHQKDSDSIFFVSIDYEVRQRHYTSAKGALGLIYVGAEIPLA